MAFTNLQLEKNSDKIYGLVQCRGDFSSEDCENCTKEAIKVALNNYTNSRSVALWYTPCFLRYSNETFFGTWEGSSMAISNDTNLEDSAVVPKGLTFMGSLALMAPKQPLMFQVGVAIHLYLSCIGSGCGKSWEEVLMAQCTRDLSEEHCRKCLDDGLRMEIYKLGCHVRYHDFQFYFSFSSPRHHQMSPEKSSAIRIKGHQ
ncbi:hypothetical protein NMG60_11009748 [Bertholletia excelsa]